MSDLLRNRMVIWIQYRSFFFLGLVFQKLFSVRDNCYWNVIVVAINSTITFECLIWYLSIVNTILSFFARYHWYIFRVMVNPLYNYSSSDTFENKKLNKINWDGVSEIILNRKSWSYYISSSNKIWNYWHSHHWNCRRNSVSCGTINKYNYYW